MIDEHRFIRMRDQVEIHAKIFERSRPIWIIATHGIGEHLGRHHYLYDLFGQDFNLFFYDLRGHGKSQGKRAYVEHFSDFAQDLGELIAYLKKTYNMERYLLLGHSMGALVVSQYLQGLTDPASFYPERVFLSAPPVSLPGLLGKIFCYAPRGTVRFLSELSLSVPLKGLVDLSTLSHDPRIAEDYRSDPLNCLALHSKLLLGMINASKDVFSRPIRARVPMYVAQGTADQVVDPKACAQYFQHVEKGPQLFEVEGAFHEMHNEIQQYRLPYFEFLSKSFLESRYRY